MPVPWKAQAIEVPIGEITIIPGKNPRQTSGFKDEDIEALAQKIGELGFLIHPITVREMAKEETQWDLNGTPAKYELVAGERRLRAAKLSQWKTITSNVLFADIGDDDLYQIRAAENIDRSGLSSYEVAFMGREMAKRMGKNLDEIFDSGLVGNILSRLDFSNLCACLNPRNGLPPEILEAWKNRHPLLRPRYLTKLHSMLREDAIAHFRESAAGGKRAKLSDAGNQRVRKITLNKIKNKIISQRETMPDGVWNYTMSILEYADGSRSEFPTWKKTTKGTNENPQTDR